MPLPTAAQIEGQFGERLMKTNLRRLALGVFAALLVTALLAVLVNRPSDRSSPDIAFSQLLADVDKDRVREVVIQGPSIHVPRASPSSRVRERTMCRGSWRSWYRGCLSLR